MNHVIGVQCTKCKSSKSMLHRTAPYGQAPNWMCLSCIKKWEPELAKNIESEDDMKLLNIIEKEVKTW